MAKGGKEGDDEVSWVKVGEIIRGTDLQNKEEVLEELRGKYYKYFNNDVGIGTRVHVARAMIAERVHKERLAQAGFSNHVIDLQGTTEYTRWNEIDALLDEYELLSPAEQAVIVQKCVENYVDTGMKEGEMVDLEDRTNFVFSKGMNVDLNTAYVNWNDKGETAKEKQIRVGRRAEAFLAKLIGVEPDNFLSTVEKKMQKRIAGV